MPSIIYFKNTLWTPPSLKIKWWPLRINLLNKFGLSMNSLRPQEARHCKSLIKDLSNIQQVSLNIVFKQVLDEYDIQIWHRSRVAQWKRAGPITQRSVDRNHALLKSFISLLFMHFTAESGTLKGLAWQAKFFKKSVILFWLLNMTIWCKHVHRLELQKFFLIFVLLIHQLG